MNVRQKNYERRKSEMRIQLNRPDERLVKLAALFFCIVSVTSCAGVSLLNRTNQGSGSPNYYLSEKDIFVNERPYEFQLRVERESQWIPYDSIKPHIIINGDRHAMTKKEDWNQRKSLWSYQPAEKCPRCRLCQ